MAFRRKRNDTKVGTIERTYGIDFGVRSDMKLGSLLKQHRVESVSQLVAKVRRDPGRAERLACDRRGMPHVGGSGAPDCDDGDEIVEVKHQMHPVTSAQVEALVERPWAQDRDVTMVSASGFTKPAHSVARRVGVKLRRR